MHRNIVIVLAIVASLSVAYAILWLVNRSRRNTQTATGLGKMQRQLGVKLLAVLGLVGCETATEPSPTTSTESDDTATDTTDSSKDTVNDTADSDDTSVNTDDTGIDTSVIVDSDSGSCSGVTCYEKVSAPSDLIWIEDLPSGAEVDGDEGIVSGTYGRKYALVPSYRVLHNDGKELTGANIFGTPFRDDLMQFTIYLPTDAAAGTYQLYLYGTTIENVREYQTYPAKQYTLLISGEISE